MRVSPLNMLLAVLAGFMGTACPGLRAQNSAYDAVSHVIRLDGGNVTYAMGVDAQGDLLTAYWGARLAPSDPIPRPHREGRAFDFDDSSQEYAASGGGLYAEPSVKITFPDGNRDLVLHYVSHELTRDGADVLMRDVSRKVDVTLHYLMDAETGILSRSAEIANNTAQAITVEQAAAGEWNLPSSDRYRLLYLTGRWGGETQLEERRLEGAATVLESRRGLTGHQFAPWFAIAKDETVTEREGEVWFGALAWSGSCRIMAEQDSLHKIRIVAGYNPFDFGYLLRPSEHLSSPVMYGGVAQHGFTEMSQLESRFQRAKILPHAPSARLRPVLYNSWEATDMNVSVEGQKALADKAAAIGVERFVMDDGWFSTRKTDHAGLGDWYPDPAKFPNGLKPLIDYVQSKGMDFGLWVEPEMVNEDSDLYRKHSDWIVHFDGRPRTQGRNQFVLNMALPEVRQYVLGFLDKLLAENKISFLKWDANRDLAEPGWPQAAPEEQKRLWVQYVLGYYAVIRDLRAKHPDVEIESCSGGGGRVDLGVMGLTDEVWTSDNTDPFDRLRIQEGFTYAYTPHVMMAWVTDSPNWYNHRSTSLTYRFLSSMQGSLGVGADLNKWTNEDNATAKHLIEEYKNIRPVVQDGDLYRLDSPRTGEISATESVAADRSTAVIFAFLHSQQMRYSTPEVFPRGLDATAMYKLHLIAGAATEGTPGQASGAYWMAKGISFNLEGDYAAAAATLSK
jgi:alpha-galactosidase